MSDDTTVTSPTTAPAQTGDEIKGNLSLDRAARHLMKLSTQREDTQTPEATPEAPSEVIPVETPQDTKPESEQAAQEPTQESEGQPEEAIQQEQADSESDDVLSQLSTLDPKAQEIAKAALERQKERLVGKFEKRIGKEVAKRKGIEQSLSGQLNEIRNQSQSQPQTLPPPPPVLNPNNPLGHISDIQSLNQEFSKAKEAVRLSEDLIAQMEDNDTNSIEYGGQEFTKQTVKSALRNAKRIVEDHAPQQAQFLQARQVNSQQAFEMFPWSKDKNSTEYVMAQRFLTDPTVANRADRDVVVGLLVEGFKAVEARKNVKTDSKPASKPKAPSSQGELSSASGATRAPESEINRARNTSEIDKLLNKKGGLKVSDAARLLLHTEQNLKKR